MNDEILLLTPGIPFNPEPFTQSFTEAKALKEITLEPLHVCLNEEPEFEFYDDDVRGYDVTHDDDVTEDNNPTPYDVIKNHDITKTYDVHQTESACSSSSDTPPELPPRDYSKHDLNTSSSQEIYLEPVIPYNSPVYELHPSLMRVQTE